MALVLLSCGARSGIDLDPPSSRRVLSDAGPLDAGAPDSGRRDGGGAPDAPAVDAPLRDPCGSPGTWVAWESPTSEDLTDVIVAAAETVIVGARGTMLRWDGAAWRPEESATRDDIAAIWIDGHGAGWFTSVSGLSRLEAGGVWRARARPPLPGISVLLALWGRAPDDVWFGGGSVTPRIGLHAHWDGAALALVDGEPTGVQVLEMRGSEDGRAIWSLSQAGHVARTIDGGAWTSVPDPEGGIGTGLWAPTADEAWFAAVHGEVQHWVRGRWERSVVGDATLYYYAVWGSSDEDVWVAGYEGAAAHFDGASWSEVALPTDRTMVAIDGTCATDAWMVGAGGTILRRVPAP